MSIIKKNNFTHTSNPFHFKSPYPNHTPLRTPNTCTPFNTPPPLKGNPKFSNLFYTIKNKRMSKSLNEIFRKRKKIYKVVEDVQARDSICSSIAESIGMYHEGDNGDSKIDFYEMKEERESSDVLSSEVLSSDVLSGDLVNGDREGDVATGPADNTSRETSTQEDRINKINQFTSLDLPIDNNKLDTYLTLPKAYLRLSKIFKGLLTVQRYNETRKLTSIFVKCKGSIERTLRTRVEEEDLKRIHSLLPNRIELKDLMVEDKGETVKTFTFRIACGGDEFDRRLMEVYKAFGEEGVSTDLSPTATIPIQPTPPSINPPTTPSPTTPPPAVNEAATNKTLSVLERIKQREAQRKEEFAKIMKAKNEERDLIKRITKLFKKESKKAIKLKEVVKVLEIFNGVRLIKQIVKSRPEEFEVKELSGEEFLILKKAKCN